MLSLVFFKEALKSFANGSGSRTAQSTAGLPAVDCEPGNSRAAAEERVAKVAKAPWDCDKISKSIVRQNVRDVMFQDSTEIVTARELLRRSYAPLFNLMRQDNRLLHPDSISALARNRDLNVDPFLNKEQIALLPFQPIDAKEAARIDGLLTEKGVKIDGNVLSNMRVLAERVLASFPLPLPQGGSEELGKYFASKVALPTNPDSLASITEALSASSHQFVARFLAGISEADRLKLIKGLAERPDFNMSEFIYCQLNYPGGHQDFPSRQHDSDDQHKVL